MAAPPADPPSLRTVAMPADANPAGDIFGGWIMSQMDIAGAIFASYTIKGRLVTVAVESMTFHKPVLVGDQVSCYCRIDRIGIGLCICTGLIITNRPTRITAGDLRILYCQIKHRYLVCNLIIT